MGIEAIPNNFVCTEYEAHSEQLAYLLATELLVACHLVDAGPKVCAVMAIFIYVNKTTDKEYNNTHLDIKKMNCPDSLI